MPTTLPNALPSLASADTLLGGEVAALPTPASPLALLQAQVNRLPAHIVRSDGYAGHPHAYALFDDMEDKDAHLFSLLQTRKLGVLARRRMIELPGKGPAIDTPHEGEEKATPVKLSAQEPLAFVERTLTTLPEFDSALLHLLGALGRGLAVLEILWQRDASGRIVPAALRPRAAERFVLGPDGAWRLLPTTGEPQDGARTLPPGKFIFARFGATDERPHGRGLCERVYWHWWFKRNNLKFWLVYNEKFGAPTVVARHRAGLGEGERARLMEVLESLQSDAGVTLPEGITLELLEASRGGTAETYHALAQWCNDEMSRAVLGQTLTSAEGSRSGSLALGRVHEAVRLDYLRADAAWLQDVINTQLIAPLLALNGFNEQPAPHWRIEVEPAPEPAAELELDRQLLRMGVPLPLRHFYGKYGRPAPAPREQLLVFDDSNVYQYHLQYGVLSINEVRAKLGLDPVAWGDAQPSPANLRALASTTGTARPAGEDPTETERESEGEGSGTPREEASTAAEEPEAEKS